VSENALSLPIIVKIY